MFNKTGQFGMSLMTSNKKINCEKHGEQFTIKVGENYICVECFRESQMNDEIY